MKVSWRGPQKSSSSYIWGTPILGAGTVLIEAVDGLLGFYDVAKRTNREWSRRTSWSIGNYYEGFFWTN